MINNQIVLLQKMAAEYVKSTEDMLVKCTEGLFSRNDALLNAVINEDEIVSDETDIFINESCISMIACFQPVTSNLRIIISIIKMSDALERMGDHCTNVARSGLVLNSRPPIKPFVDLPKMKDTVVKMLKDSSEALVNGNVELAKQVLADDDIVDEYKAKITAELRGFLKKDNAEVDSILEIINIVNNLERIADLTTNICEDVLYIELGEVYRHCPKNP
ncbi:MAG: phosphate signaling complex protein PhoU [Elusimicrobia bacterium]|nr:phosphate signaling complex protein PhoU [Elusimicrobiota bacterium]